MALMMHFPAGREEWSKNTLKSCIQGIGILLLTAAVVLGQGTPNRISGLITDSSGGIITNAAVRAEERATGVVTKSASNDRGYYLLQLPIGTYNIVVSNPGFQSSVTQDVQVNV